MGFSVGSGDLLAVELARQLGAKQLLYAMDVSGLFDNNPNSHSSANLLKRITLEQLGGILKDMEQKGAKDASGAMRGKLSAISTASDLISKGMEVTLFSMIEQGSLKMLLEGIDIPCTRIVKG
jgi:isopentenyl phosphate kinase